MQNRLTLDIISPDKKGKPYRRARIQHIGNALVTQGQDQLIAMLATSASACSSFIQAAGLGTSTAAPSSSQVGLQSSLAAASVTLAAGSLVGSHAGNMTLNYQMTITGGNGSIGEIGLFYTNQVTTNMFARQTFTQSNKQSADTIQATYQIIMSANPS